MNCKCKQLATERVINMKTGQIKDVCAPCGRDWIAKGGYKGSWWYVNGQPKTIRVVSSI